MPLADRGGVQFFSISFSFRQQVCEIIAPPRLHTHTWYTLDPPLKAAVKVSQNNMINWLQVMRSQMECSTEWRRRLRKLRLNLIVLKNMEDLTKALLLTVLWRSYEIMTWNCILINRYNLFAACSSLFFRFWLFITSTCKIGIIVLFLDVFVWLTCSKNAQR